MTTDPFILLLEKVKHRRLFLSAAAGNSGDKLLQRGLQEYLYKNNFLLTDNIEDSEVVLTHGGSNINDVWKVGIALFINNLEKYPTKIFIVAPHTFTFYETDFAGLLHSYTQPIYFFARDQLSFKNLQSMDFHKNISVYLSHDTAFLLEGTDYMKRLIAGCSDSYVLHAMRTDRESAVAGLDLDRIPQNFWERGKLAVINYQLHKYMKRMTALPNSLSSVILQDVSYLPYDDFIKKVQNASVVHTDRLHVGILAALLGKPVFLYDTKYKKVSEIYRQSLSGYKNVVPMFD